MNRAAEIFAEAIELNPSERAAYVARTCDGDDELRAQIEGLLRGHAQAQLVFAAPVTDRPCLGMPTEEPGDVIGRYTLLEKIGEGGCGAVWRAEQREPVRREVALKVIKLGMDTREVIARFEAERQALALMDHPNIARVFDGGATESGRPFFVMEFVHGVPITRYCDEQKLPTAARLELFIQVCHAVQHAHQKGIIHRDLKPSNILVSDDRLDSTRPSPVALATPKVALATPKVIDFGIAKATQGRLTDATVFTAFEQFIGTPAYMSPEQAEFNARDIDTRSDIYSLGVLLYELLTGRAPFDPKSLATSGLDEIRRIIREVDPPRPSTRLAALNDVDRGTIARHRDIAPVQLASLLRGDLDWIVMRCIEKDRTRRYDTANGLASDIQRYMRNEPIVARPPSTAYVLQKLVRRNRAMFAGIAAVAVMFIVGTAVSSWQALRARQSEQLATGARANAESLLGYFFTDHGAQLSDFGHIPVLQQVSDKAVAYYEGLPPNLQTRETRAGHALALAGGGANLGWNSSIAKWGEPLARERLDRAMRIFQELEATGPPSAFMRVAFAGVSSGMAWQFFEEGRHVEVPPIAQRGIDAVEPVLRDAKWGEWAQHGITNLAYIKGISFFWSRDLAESIDEFQRAIASAEQADQLAKGYPRPGLRVAQIKAWCPFPLGELGRRREARAMLDESSTALRNFLRHEPHLLSARWSLAIAVSRIALHADQEWDFELSRRALREVEAEYTDLLKLQPKHTSYAFNLARALDVAFNEQWRLGNFAAAEELARRRVELLSGEWGTPLWRGRLLAARLDWARVTAATNRQRETGEHLAAAAQLQRRILEERGPGAQHLLFAADIEAGRRSVHFHRLEWQSMRSNAEFTLQHLRSLDQENVAKRRLNAARFWAWRDLVRAAFEMRDYAAANAGMKQWIQIWPSHPKEPYFEQRFENVANELLKIEVLARAGEFGLAHSCCADVWPEVVALLAAGPDHIFNQVQTARALSVRADIDGTAAEKRAWLIQAVNHLRPAATAGRLTRYERDVLLARIEAQLAAAQLD